MNYTKGKWEAQKQKNLASGKYEWVIKVKEDDVKSRVIATTPYANKYNDHEANAHLIEAAPAMYEEWEDVLCVAQSNQDKTGEWWRDWLTHKAKRILAKAEGK